MASGKGARGFVRGFIAGWGMMDQTMDTMSKDRARRDATAAEKLDQDRKLRKDQYDKSAKERELGIKERDLTSKEANRAATGAAATSNALINRDRLAETKRDNEAKLKLEGSKAIDTKRYRDEKLKLDEKKAMSEGEKFKAEWKKYFDNSGGVVPGADVTQTTLTPEEE